MLTITSANNPMVKLTKQLNNCHRQRKKNSQTILEGSHLIAAALESNYPLELIIVGESAIEQTEISALLTQTKTKNIKVVCLADNIYKELTLLDNAVPIMAIIPFTSKKLATINSDCLIVNGVQDTGNVGTLLRTAAAIGVQDIIFTRGSAKAWSPKTLRAGMGAQFALTIYENIDVADLLTNVKVSMLATSSHTKQTIYDTNLSEPVAWIMGHEGQGVDEQLLTNSTKVTIPQPNGIESLNVAIAGSLCMYEMLRQREYS